MNKAASKILNDVAISKKKFRIKLLGDSITHGVGGRGFEQNGAPIYGGFSRNPYGYCWANKFKEYMEGHFNCSVVNNACTGTRIEFIIDHFEQLVDSEDDIVICAIGTNNRHLYHYEVEKKPTPEEHSEYLYGRIAELYGMLKAAKKAVIFIANIPACGKNEEDGDDYWRLIHMNDINAIYKMASAEYGFALISFYDLFVSYCEKNGVTVDSLLADGLHPNDRGHDVMYSLILDELGIA